MVNDKLPVKLTASSTPLGIVQRWLAISSVVTIHQFDDLSAALAQSHNDEKSEKALALPLPSYEVIDYFIGHATYPSVALPPPFDNQGESALSRRVPSPLLLTE
ncbi:hypothetical protein EDD73_13134 [Heliophilum fasciatum]|uniref:Uncharacterized protein n=1 Tax=Heliophilum fasciatum TaxID=35700 RepID=A0A4R2RG30_9FIRM|nr:hypothetical protein EDD73_13134 [Heliophilum fasciatum]